eukprot:968480-Amphidinium_carterae.1
MPTLENEEAWKQYHKQTANRGTGSSSSGTSATGNPAASSAAAAAARPDEEGHPFRRGRASTKMPSDHGTPHPPWFVPMLPPTDVRMVNTPTTPELELIMDMDLILEVLTTSHLRGAHTCISLMSCTCTIGISPGGTPH